MSDLITAGEFARLTSGDCGCCEGNADCADVTGRDGCCPEADDRRFEKLSINEWESCCTCHELRRHDTALRAALDAANAEIKRLREFHAKDETYDDLKRDRDAALARAERTEQEREHYKSDAAMYQRELDAALARAEAAEAKLRLGFIVIENTKRDRDAARAEAESARAMQDNLADSLNAQSAELRAARAEAAAKRTEWSFACAEAESYRAKAARLRAALEEIASCGCLIRGVYDECPCIRCIAARALKGEK